MATRWSKFSSNSAIRLGVAEISIAIFTLPAIFLPAWADGLVATLGTELLVSWRGVVVKGILAAVVVLPPSIVMGTTMPMFIQVITDLGGTVRRSGVWTYSLNMLGGVLGLWLVSNVLLESVGVQGAMLWTVAGNLLIALTAFGVSKRVGYAEEAAIHQRDAECDTVPRCDDEANSPKYVFVLAFVSGVVVLANEVLILRLLALVAPSSIQTTSALLANVILFLALGAVAVAVMNRLRISSKNQLIIGAAGASLFCLLCPLILYQTTNQLVSVRYLAAMEMQTISSIGQYWWVLFTIIACCSGAAMFSWGLVFPSIMSIHSAHDPLGRSVGMLLAINGLGGLLGAEFANFLLVFQFGIYQGFVILAVAAATLTITFCLYDQRKLAAIGIAIGVSVVGMLSFDSFQELRYLSPRAKNKFTIEETFFGRDGVLMVVKDQSGSRSMLMNNQYILGSSGTSAATSERRQLLLPWLLHPECRTVCCLGFATGISASGLEALDAPPTVTSIELSEKVVEIARGAFGKHHQAFFERAGNKVLLEDARTFMACAENEYDLIVADLFRPHGAGESRLFSLEHFQNVKQALRADGLFCQWLPAHQLNKAQFETIANTFLQVFPKALVLCGGTSSQTPTVGLCGWQNNQSEKQWETNDIVDKIAAIRKQKGISDVLTLNAQLLVVGVLDESSYSSSPTNTLDNAQLEIAAGKFWITKDLRPTRLPDDLENGFLSGINWKTFVHELHKTTKPVLDPIHRQQYLNVLK